MHARISSVLRHSSCSLFDIYRVAAPKTPHDHLKSCLWENLSFLKICLNSTAAPKNPQRGGGFLTRLFDPQILPVGCFCRGHPVYWVLPHVGPFFPKVVGSGERDKNFFMWQPPFCHFSAPYKLVVSFLTNMPFHCGRLNVYVRQYE